MDLVGLGQGQPFPGRSLATLWEGGLAAREELDRPILSEANVHSPNEHAHIPSYYRGIETFIRFFAKVADS